jgi:hypothetical protein
VGSSTFGRYQNISSEQTWNMFISDNTLVNFAGYKRVYDLLPSGSGRGIFHSVRGNLIIVVVNARVYSLNTTLTPTLIGTINTSVGEVFIDENLNRQICIVDGLSAYIYNYSQPPNLTVQTAGVLSGGTLIPNYVCYHNTFFLFGNGNKANEGNLWYAYSFDDATHIKQTTELTLQTKPDYALAVVRLPGQGNNVLVIGSSVCEVWTQVGGLQNYRRNSTVNIDYGCLSVSTIATSDKYVAWLGVNASNAPVIMIYAGQGIETISTDGIDFVLSQLQHPEESTAMLYRQDGHLFYQITFYNALDNLTFAYDFTTSKFFNLSDAHINYHPARSFVYFNNNTYFVSLNNASLYQSSTTITTYNENLAGNNPDLINDIPRTRITSNTRAENSNPFVANSLAVTIEQGNDEAVTGLSLAGNINLLINEDSVPGFDDLILTEWGTTIGDEDSGLHGIGADDNFLAYRPRVDLSISVDGGISWSNTVTRELNPVGYRKNMLTWERMGLANDITFKFRFWGQSRFVVYNGILDVNP